jgi:predicted transcriptional regulator
MPKSFRIDPSLERRLQEVAEREAVPVSAVVREAIARHCDEVLGTDLRASLADVIGAVQSEGGRARRTGRAFADALAARVGR